MRGRPFLHVRAAAFSIAFVPCQSSVSNLFFFLWILKMPGGRRPGARGRGGGAGAGARATHPRTPENRLRAVPRPRRRAGGRREGRGSTRPPLLVLLLWDPVPEKVSLEVPDLWETLPGLGVFGDDRNDRNTTSLSRETDLGTDQQQTTAGPAAERGERGGAPPPLHRPPPDHTSRCAGRPARPPGLARCEGRPTR